MLDKTKKKVNALLFLINELEAPQVVLPRILVTSLLPPSVIDLNISPFDSSLVAKRDNELHHPSVGGVTVDILEEGEIVASPCPMEE